MLSFFLKIKIVLIAFLFHQALLVSTFAADQFPGFPPDCWKTSREYHIKNDWLNGENTYKIEKIELQNYEDYVLSPNGGYWFLSKSDRPESSVIIYAEKNHHVKITFLNVKSISDAKWINEKLLFVRVWWGRIAATDFIFDVEQEEMIYKEGLTSGYIAMQQYKEGCALHGGCKCINQEIQDRLSN